MSTPTVTDRRAASAQNPSARHQLADPGEEFHTLWAMTPDERIADMWRSELTLGQLCQWSSRAQHEVPLLGDEFAWIVMRTPEWTCRGRVKMDKVEDRWTRRGHSDGVVGQSESKGTDSSCSTGRLRCDRLGCELDREGARGIVRLFRTAPPRRAPDCPSIPRPGVHPRSIPTGPKLATSSVPTLAPPSTRRGRPMTIALSMIGSCSVTLTVSPSALEEAPDGLALELMHLVLTLTRDEAWALAAALTEQLAETPEGP